MTRGPVPELVEGPDRNKKSRRLLHLGKLLLFLPHRKVESNNTPQSFFLYFWFGCLGLFGYIRSISPSESIEGIILVSR